MRQEVLDELSKRIRKLEKVAKPHEINTGMTGSFICFIMYIDTMTAMTKEEFENDVYDDWLREQHNRIYNKVMRAYVADKMKPKIIKSIDRLMDKMEKQITTVKQCNKLGDLYFYVLNNMDMKITQKEFDNDIYDFYIRDKLKAFTANLTD